MNNPKNPEIEEVKILLDVAINSLFKAIQILNANDSKPSKDYHDNPSHPIFLKERDRYAHKPWERSGY
tara:strand:- start:89 stop:292 length:204 start_codon:yes stop_codon:yes gene_type:complete